MRGTCFDDCKSADPSLKIFRDGFEIHGKVLRIEQVTCKLGVSYCPLTERGDTTERLRESEKAVELFFLQNLMSFENEFETMCCGGNRFCFVVW